MLNEMTAREKDTILIDSINLYELLSQFLLNRYFREHQTSSNGIIAVKNNILTNNRKKEKRLIPLIIMLISTSSKSIKMAC